MLCTKHTYTHTYLPHKTSLSICTKKIEHILCANVFLKRFARCACAAVVHVPYLYLLDLLFNYLPPQKMVKKIKKGKNIFMLLFCYTETWNIFFKFMSYRLIWLSKTIKKSFYLKSFKVIRIIRSSRIYEYNINILIQNILQNNKNWRSWWYLPARMRYYVE